jgi:hypothetical protein
MFLSCDNIEPNYYMTCAFGEFDLPDPGQDTDQCYDAAATQVECSSFVEGNQYYGQDGHYNIHPKSYDTAVPGEVADQVTTLIWQQDPSASVMDHAAAVASCSGDWRLPKRHELQTILHYGIASDAPWYIDEASFNVPAGLDGEFWTATDVAGSGGDLAWVVDFKTGMVQHADKTSFNAWVRCVK